jgi:hypothetical protein
LIFFVWFFCLIFLFDFIYWFSGAYTISSSRSSICNAHLE